MNINWVLANNVDLPANIDIAKIKSIGSVWGSWRTWRACQTDNVICHNAVKAEELIGQNIMQLCNFYIPNKVYLSLDEPTGVRSYGGEFSYEVDQQDEIVAMHLAAGCSDIVLLLGFDWSQKPVPNDPQQKLLQHNYTNFVREAIVGNAKTQWVLVDHAQTIKPELSGIGNLTQDTLANVFGMLSN